MDVFADDPNHETYHFGIAIFRVNELAAVYSDKSQTVQLINFHDNNLQVIDEIREENLPMISAVD